MDGMLVPPESQARMRFTWTMPASIARVCNFKKVTIVELTADEEVMASKRCGNDALQMTAQLTKQAIVAIDEKPVSLADGSTDIAWNRMGALARQLVMRAYNDIHNPKPEDLDSFMTSRQVEVG